MNAKQIMMAFSTLLEDMEQNISDLKDEVEDLQERLNELEKPPEGEPKRDLAGTVAGTRSAGS